MFTLEETKQITFAYKEKLKSNHKKELLDLDDMKQQIYA
jgi:hypothetical protein